jgi:hypothetical protein
MENDATACFDRMLPSLVMISLRAYGVPEELVTLIGKMLENMCYKIKTKIGISNTNTRKTHRYMALDKGEPAHLAFGH